MMISAPRTLMLAVAACAAASGCAQWQPGQGPDSLATALDDHGLALDDQLIARCVSVLGDGSPPPAAIRQPVATHRSVVLASLEEPLDEPLGGPFEEPPMPPAEGDDAEPLPRPFVPTYAAAPALISVERPAEPTAVETPAAKKPAAAAPQPAAVTATSACDACCCGDSVVCPVAASCPVHGMCGWCHQMFTRPEPGPPPIRYRPPMPPKFLPVPTQPILAPARPDAPEPWRGNIEVGWGPQLTFPPRD